ncbi:hydrogenase maturation protease [Candidatus Poribacteria bacterium]|nr:hydrogenase maturation protease [Candidatus Poribacteria bacterium]
MTGQVLVIGVGNEYRGDDSAGLLLARRVAALQIPDVEVSEASGEGAGLIHAWTDHANVFLFDAVRSGRQPGAIHRLAASESPIPSDFFNYSTHAFGLAEAVELSRVLGHLPANLVIYGIEAANVHMGESLTPEVERAMGAVLERVVPELQLCVGTLSSASH